MSKIALGTVQFGLNYGINNRGGKIPQSEAMKILNYCIENNINVIDTATNYGNSENVLGKCFKTLSGDFNVISKLPKCNLNKVESICYDSLKKLGIQKLYGYLIHDFDFFENNARVWHILLKLKENGFINKIGFSLYYPSQLEKIFASKIHFDILQVPYNVLDQRFGAMFQKLKKNKVEIHVRSVFLQGLLFKKPTTLNSFFNPIKKKIDYLHQVSFNKKISVSNLLLGFTHINDHIDKIVIGVDSMNDLKDNINYINYVSRVNDVYDELIQLAETNEEMILPTNWKLK